ncbi:hypothetical protein D3C76_1701260 [compost metagenome]
MDDVGLIELVQVFTECQVQVIRRFNMQFEHGVEVGQVIIEPQRGVVNDCP